VTAQAQEFGYIRFEDLPDLLKELLRRESTAEQLNRADVRKLASACGSNWYVRRTLSRTTCDRHKATSREECVGWTPWPDRRFDSCVAHHYIFNHTNSFRVDHVVGADRLLLPVWHQCGAFSGIILALVSVTSSHNRLTCARARPIKERSRPNPCPASTPTHLPRTRLHGRCGIADSPASSRPRTRCAQWLGTSSADIPGTETSWL
jgi:hypothetical protein